MTSKVRGVSIKRGRKIEGMIEPNWKTSTDIKTKQVQDRYVFATAEYCEIIRDLSTGVIVDDLDTPRVIPTSLGFY